MFAMQQHQYVYAAAPAAPRQYSAQGTSSAFSSSANPDEDWTKISDLAERRRIQNRIAQRNYRKKLKRRLEDLERRAGSSDGTSPSSSPTGADKSAAKSIKKSSTPKKQLSPPIVQQQIVVPPPKPVTQSQFTPPMHPEDDLLFPPTYDGRERSHTPPMFAYSAYPPPEDMMIAPYASSAPQHYRPMAPEAAYADWNTAAAAVPVTLPPMTHFSDALRPDGFADESMMPYMSYGFAANPYDHHSNPNTPPLSHSFDHSANCSEAGYEYPTTPLSMPGSPNLLH